MVPTAYLVENLRDILLGSECAQDFKADDYLKQSSRDVLMGVLSQICCISSEHLLIRIPLEVYFRTSFSNIFILEKHFRQNIFFKRNT